MDTKAPERLSSFESDTAILPSSNLPIRAFNASILYKFSYKA